MQKFAVQIDGSAIFMYAIGCRTIKTYPALISSYVQSKEFKEICERKDADYEVESKRVTNGRVLYALNKLTGNEWKDIKEKANKDILKQEGYNIQVDDSPVSFLSALFKMRKESQQEEIDSNCKENVEEVENIDEMHALVQLNAIEADEETLRDFQTFPRRMQMYMLCSTASVEETFEYIKGYRIRRDTYANMKPKEKKKLILETAEYVPVYDWSELAFFLKDSVENISSILASKPLKNKVNFFFKKNLHGAVLCMGNIFEKVNQETDLREMLNKLKVLWSQGQDEEMKENPENTAKLETETEELVDTKTDETAEVKAAEEPAKAPEKEEKAEEPAKAPEKEEKAEEPAKAPEKEEKAEEPAKAPEKEEKAEEPAKVPEKEETPKTSKATSESSNQSKDIASKKDSSSSEKTNSSSNSSGTEAKVVQTSATPTNKAATNVSTVQKSYVRSKENKFRQISQDIVEWYSGLNYAGDMRGIMPDTNIMMDKVFRESLKLKPQTKIYLSTIVVHELRGLLLSDLPRRAAEARQAIANIAIHGDREYMQLLDNGYKAGNAFDIELVDLAKEHNLIFLTADSGAAAYARASNCPVRYLRNKMPQEVVSRKQVRSDLVAVLDTTVWNKNLIGYIKNRYSKVVITSEYAKWLNKMKGNNDVNSSIVTFQTDIVTDMQDYYNFYYMQHADSGTSREEYETELVELCKKNGYVLITSDFATKAWAWVLGVRCDLYGYG